MKPLVSFFAIICVAFPLSGAATENDPGTWITFSTTDAFQTDGQDSRWHYWFDAQARYFDLGSGVNQWLARPGIGYEINENVTAWLGYARFRSRNSAGDVSNEDRYWQQINWSAGSWNGGKVSMRARLEQRSISVGDDTGLVARFLAKYVRPIAKYQDTNLIIGIEPFVDLRDTDWGGDAGLGQNRVFIGFGRRVSDRLSIEAGYMNQYIWRDNAENRINHLGVLSFKVKL
ncbi:MAG: DUF2490 domain-containing protein [Woeseiaceae bacterium]|nr:DUF2490 domain-containing protein [Woeseiaceae bacterium]